MTKLHRLAELGQSIWYDNISRGLLNGGGLQALVEQGVRGVTSNPTILNQAIGHSDDYDDALALLATTGKSTLEIYEDLVIEDIRRAADILRPVFEASEGEDGYVSLEVNPHLAHDTEGTVAEAKRLYTALDRPNVMIKVPATSEGIPAIESLIGQGVNVNVTLIFSLDVYRDVALAYIAGLERRAVAGLDLSQSASVASFFVSRIDTAVDRLLDSIASPQAKALKGKIAVACAKSTYALFKEIFAGERWERLADRGARVQRPLWASTSTKNPAYPDTLYVEPLIGPHTVNTLPPVTLEAFLDHGRVALTLEEGIDEARDLLRRLADLGISLDAVTRQLLDDGVIAFSRSFDSLLAVIEAKK